MSSQDDEIISQTSNNSFSEYQEIEVSQNDDHESESENFNKSFADTEQGQEPPININQKLEEIIKLDTTKVWLVKSFTQFLLSFQDQNQNYVYRDKIKKMQMHNKSSIEVNFNDLVMSNDRISYWIIQEPMVIFPYLNYAAKNASESINFQYSQIHPLIYVKIVQVKLQENLRDLRCTHLNTLIKVQGVITKRSIVYSQLICGNEIGPIFYNSGDNPKVGACIVCQSSSGFELSQKKTKYRNYQTITIQESPQHVPAGRVPRWKEVILLNDNIEQAKPGDEVEIIGVYTYKYDYGNNIKSGFPVFSTIIECNNIIRLAEVENLMDQSFEEQIKKLSQKNNIAQIIANSIAPSIHQNNDIKMGLALSLFGGVNKDVQNKHRIRGDINVMILGDPGMAKSQFLKSIQQCFPRCIYTTGKGATAVGLTACVRKDYQSKEWVLEGGALVLADKGVCLIDEFDKMNEHDRTSIHEAMEQQTISISKAGIVAQLQARCAVITAANPIKGRYNSQLSFMDNVDLTEPILSRFDLLFVVKDDIIKENDFKLAGFVLNSHINSHPNNKEKVSLNSFENEQIEIIDKDLLKMYIAYARKHFQPKLSNINKDKIAKFYGELRQKSQQTGGMPIAVRHLESIIRMAEAHAKIHLRNNVIDKDVDMAINMILQSFIQSQKYSVAKQIQIEFKKYIIYQKDELFLIHKKLEQLMKQQQQGRIGDNKVSINKDILQQEILQIMNMSNLNEYFRSNLFKKYYQLVNKQIIINE